MGGICSSCCSEKAEGGAADESTPLVRRRSTFQGSIFSLRNSIFGANNALFQDLIYFNHAGQGRFSKEVLAAGKEALNRPPWKMIAVEEAQDVRQLFAQLIQAPDDDGSNIAIMPSTAFAMTLAAQNLFRLYKSKGGGKVLLLKDQYPSAVYPWQEMCDRHNHQQKQKNNNNNKTPASKWSINVVPYPEDEYGHGIQRTWTDSILEHLSKASNHDIRVVCVPPLHWADGRVIDLERVAKICHSRDIHLIVDATQCAGIFPINVEKIRPTLVASSSHKWLGGPSGVSLVFLDKKVHDSWRPLDQHERGRDLKGDTAVNSATKHLLYPEEFYEDARKFDAGGKPNPMLLPMLRASLQQLVERDIELAQSQLGRLMEPLLDFCKENDFIVPSRPHANHLIGIQPPPALHLKPEQLVNICQYLEEQKGIVLQARCGGFRVAPALNDTKPWQVKQLIQALDEVFFGSAKEGVWA